ncbi:hypothetical protein [Pedobacter steynii]
MFQIFLDDKVNNKYTELDAEGVDFTTIISVSDINNISKRNETITTDFLFKNTPNNNKAFGYAFMVTKHISELDTSNKLFFNFNAQVLVDAYVYENGIQILKGQLRLKSISINSNGEIQYKSCITGSLIEFNQIIGTSSLADLDFSELEHIYNITNIQNSWINPQVSGFTYPLINYGMKFNTSAAEDTDNVNPYNVLNFRPAICVSKIFEKIFDSAGYSYALKGTDEFKSMFNTLLIPSNSEFLQTKTVFEYPPEILTKTALDNADTEGYGDIDNKQVSCAVQFEVFFNGGGVLESGAAYFVRDSLPTFKQTGRVFNIVKTFKTDGTFTFKYSYKYNNSIHAVAKMQLVERIAKNPSNDAEYNNSYNWDVVSEQVVTLDGSNTWKDVTGTINIPEREYQNGKQILFRLIFVFDSIETGIWNQSNFDYNISEAEYKAGTTFTSNVNLGDTYTPAIIDVPALDFLQSVRALFNLYIYPDKNTKTVYFESYDSFYQKTKGVTLFNSALDWTKKIDVSKGWQIDTNINIPKNYNFKFKTDSDFINDTYQKKYNKSYGDYQVTDSFGITDKKDVELIFSPTPLVTVSPSFYGTSGFNISIPWIYKLDGASVAPLKTNIRILGWNGVKTGTTYTVISETFDVGAGSWTGSVVLTTGNAPCASNFISNSSGTILKDLHFGEPREIYYRENYNVPFSYEYYKNQIIELKDANINYLTMEAYLNENDINQLDLSVPIFIDLPAFGSAYFKLINVDYKNSNQTSTIYLQKIIPSV